MIDKTPSITANPIAAMLMMKRLLVTVSLMLSCIYSQAQWQVGIGYTAGWFYSKANIAGGFSCYLGHNILQSENASLSISTNAKLGMADRVGTAVVVPLIFVLVLYDKNNNNRSQVVNAADDNDWDGGKIHLFADLPLLLHYNFGLGSTSKTNKFFGFYIGGGLSYTLTGYTDTLGFSKGTGFAGCVVDGGVRIDQDADVNVSNTFSLRKPIGPMAHPSFTEITLSVRLDYGQEYHRKRRRR